MADKVQSMNYNNHELIIIYIEIPRLFKYLNDVIFQFMMIGYGYFFLIKTTPFMTLQT